MMPKDLYPERSIIVFLTPKRYNLFNSWNLFENDKLGGRTIKVVSENRMPKGIDLMMVDTKLHKLDDKLPNLKELFVMLGETTGLEEHI